MLLFHHCCLPRPSYCMDLCSHTCIALCMQSCPLLNFILHEPKVIFPKMQIWSSHSSECSSSVVSCCTQHKIQTPHLDLQGPEVLCELAPFTLSPSPPHSSRHVRTRQIVSCHSPGPLYVLFPLPGSFFIASAFLSSDRSLEVCSSERPRCLKLDVPHLSLYLSSLFPFTHLFTSDFNYSMFLS